MPFSTLVSFKEFQLVLIIILPAAVGPGVCTASNRRVPEAEQLSFWEVERGRCVGRTISPQSVSRLSRQYGIFDISQSYTPPRSVMGISSLLLFSHFTLLDYESYLQQCLQS
jgi:hypothetical protein